MANICVADERVVIFPETLERETVLLQNACISLVSWRSTPEESSVRNIHFRIKYICRIYIMNFLHTYIFL